MTGSSLALALLAFLICRNYGKPVDESKTMFYLIERGNPLKFQEFADSLDDLKYSDISEPNRTVVLLHGLGGNFNSSSNLLIAEALLRREGYTIIIADYEKAAEGPDYISAAKNMERVGKDVGNFLLAAQEDGYIALKSTTLIGFSLGAHVAGIAGYTIKESSGYLDKIIGLDPPSPWFADVGPELKLDKSDAGHVVVIHTASGYLSMVEPFGHVDFYPNGGTEPQPLCEFSKLASIVCSHLAAYRYLAESIMKPGFIATKCPSWKDYETGLCEGNEKTFMGFDTDSNVEGTYYLRTNKEPPFGSPINYDYGEIVDESQPEVFQDAESDPTKYRYYTPTSGAANAQAFLSAYHLAIYHLFINCIFVFITIKL
ncbi:phospholipase A1-like isoform X2 [Cimex lectularius]|uniref:Lipase domain-containing protein n=1 Tax=Cimex lectularius TaxID=79782 RepID=A0A8I6RFM0_CIMLE|nr:phospholipase A1-like isoform X2 [Cimex lectularius]